jgi:hypothetical protein
MKLFDGINKKRLNQQTLLCKNQTKSADSTFRRNVRMPDDYGKMPIDT